jgi:hypothetical protein
MNTNSHIIPSYKLNISVLELNSKIVQVEGRIMRFQMKCAFSEMEN